MLYFDFYPWLIMNNTGTNLKQNFPIRGRGRLGFYTSCTVTYIKPLNLKLFMGGQKLAAYLYQKGEED